MFNPTYGLIDSIRGLEFLEAGAHRISIALAIHSLDCTLRAAMGRDKEIAPTYPLLTRLIPSCIDGIQFVRPT